MGRMKVHFNIGEDANSLPLKREANNRLCSKRSANRYITHVCSLRTDLAAAAASESQAGRRTAAKRERALKLVRAKM